MTHKIIQWNCRGLKTNLNELFILISNLLPAIICLQETFLKHDQTLNIKNFTQYNHINNTDQRASGGATILIRNDIPQSEIKITTKLQAVAAQATLPKTTTICSLYLPPNETLNRVELDQLIHQLPKPFILMGDFNCHGVTWGCQNTNKRGKIIEEFLDQNQLCCYNDGTNTYLHSATGTYSAIDLTICDPSIFMDYHWSVYEETCGSDHFPIILENQNPVRDSKTPRWNLQKADWQGFRDACLTELTSEPDNGKEDILHFTNTLHKIAEQNIPRTSTSSKFNNPWFNHDCRKAVRARRAALRKFKNYPSKENLETYKNNRAKARRTIKDAKQTSWREYVSKINASTKPKKVWDMVNKISGKNHKPPLKHIIHNGTKITNKREIAEHLAENLSQTSSVKNQKEKFQTIKKQQEKRKINFQSDNTENYNEPFSIRELSDSLNKAHNTATGPDEIPYEFLKQLPTPSKEHLLRIFNHIWANGIIPNIWKQATIIPIPKTPQNSSDPTNYRPIALTSCICKTFERMVNNRLVWYLEKNNLISEHQAGFRNKRSPIDHAIKLETYIRDAFIQKEHVVTIFFDLEKAYDTTWKYGILKDLEELGLKGRMPILIKNFLDNRSFRIRLGDTLSDPKEQEMGVPQGSILSVTLFNIKINNIVKNINVETECAIYVDDFMICFKAKYMRTIERHLQMCLNKIHNWATINGFTFSQTKTKCIHFCQHRKMHPDPVLKLGDNTLTVTKEYKYLGIIFDNKLSFIPHIKYLKKKCNKTIQLLRIIAHTNWGADQKTLLKLYRSLIRSKIDYGCPIYGSARKSYIKEIDTIHHQGLRLALGAFTTSPIESLYAEANEPSLSMRREKLSLQYYTKLASCPSNPTYKCVFHPKYEALYERKKNTIKSYGLRMKQTKTEAKLDTSVIHQTTTLQHPPWLTKQPKVIFDLIKHTKGKTNPITYHEEFQIIKEKYQNHQAIYTDGSKTGDKAACAAIYKHNSLLERLPDGASIYSAEASAINSALKIIETHSTNNYEYIIFTDNMSVLTALENRKTNDPITTKILDQIEETSTNKDLVFCWIPSHVGIRGNDRADQAAKEALKLEPSHVKIPYTDLKPTIKKYITDKWQEQWKTCQNNKLHSIQKQIGKKINTHNMPRKEEVVMTRLRIGHSYITHSHLLKGEEAPHCIPCQKPYTIEHLLTNCLDLEQIRRKYYQETTLEKILTETNPDQIFKYLREAGIYQKI